MGPVGAPDALHPQLSSPQSSALPKDPWTWPTDGMAPSTRAKAKTRNLQNYHQIINLLRTSPAQSLASYHAAAARHYPKFHPNSGVDENKKDLSE